MSYTRREKPNIPIAQKYDESGAALVLVSIPYMQSRDDTMNQPFPSVKRS